MPSFTRESGGTQHVAVMGVNRIGKGQSWQRQPQPSSDTCTGASIKPEENCPFSTARAASFLKKRAGVRARRLGGAVVQKSAEARMDRMQADRCGQNGRGTTSPPGNGLKKSFRPKSCDRLTGGLNRLVALCGGLPMLFTLCLVSFCKLPCALSGLGEMAARQPVAAWCRFVLERVRCL